jgi:hypothetical protein
MALWIYTDIPVHVDEHLDRPLQHRFLGEDTGYLVHVVTRWVMDHLHSIIVSSLVTKLVLPRTESKHHGLET